MTPQQAPLMAMATEATIVLPTRSAKRPATMHPTAPLAITTNAAVSASHAGSPLAARLARIMAGAHVHIAYSSHMCPKYPKFARRTPRLFTTAVACDRSKRWLGSAYGPSRTNRRMMMPPTAARIETAPTLTRQLDEPMALTRYGDALPNVSAPTSTPRAKPRPSRNQVAI